MEEKTCIKCNKLLSIKLFNGKRNVCNSCRLEQIKYSRNLIKLNNQKNIQIIKEKYFENDSEKLSGLTEWQGNKFKTNLIKNILILDYKIMKLFNNKIAGLSNFVVCKKNA